jgi:hypothetical protein
MVLPCLLLTFLTSASDPLTNFLFDKASGLALLSAFSYITDCTDETRTRAFFVTEIMLVVARIVPILGYVIIFILDRFSMDYSMHFLFNRNQLKVCKYIYLNSRKKSLISSSIIMCSF